MKKNKRYLNIGFIVVFLSLLILINVAAVVFIAYYSFFSNSSVIITLLIISILSVLTLIAIEIILLLKIKKEKYSNIGKHGENKIAEFIKIKQLKSFSRIKFSYLDNKNKKRYKYSKEKLTLRQANYLKMLTTFSIRCYKNACSVCEDVSDETINNYIKNSDEFICNIENENDITNSKTRLATKLNELKSKELYTNIIKLETIVTIIAITVSICVFCFFLYNLYLNTNVFETSTKAGKIVFSILTGVVPIFLIAYFLYRIYKNIRFLIFYVRGISKFGTIVSIIRVKYSIKNKYLFKITYQYIDKNGIEQLQSERINMSKLAINLVFSNQIPILEYQGKSIVNFSLMI